MPDFTLKDGATLRGGTYRIIRFLSAGGFGCTYEAVHVGLDRRVAIKEFFVRDFCNRDLETSHVSVGTQSKKELAEKLKRKFLEEARAVAHLNHPGIVRVTDVFEENGTAYFVMDYIDGSGLNQLIAEKGRLPEAEALDYIRQTAHALAHVHDTKRLHLDIKPANIMVDKSGHTVLIDFGVSKQYDEAAGENTSTLVGRTPGYAPIEQMSPKLRTFTPATDIYALAATLYKAVTGTTPPDSTELHISAELTFPAGLSASTIKAIESAMKMRAEDRPQTVADFLAILDAPAPAQTPPPPSEETRVDVPVNEPDVRKPKIKKKNAVLAGFILLALVVVAYFLLSDNNRIKPGYKFYKDDIGYEVIGPMSVKIFDGSKASGDLSIPDIVYESGDYFVDVIGDDAFKDCNLSSVTIPGKVKTIGIGAFSFCKDLTSVTIQSGVETIDPQAFFHCEGLTSIIIPSSVEYIGDQAFAFCIKLDSVKIENTNCQIAVDAFSDTPYNAQQQLDGDDIPDTEVASDDGDSDSSPGPSERNEDTGNASRSQQEEQQRRQKAEATADVAGAFGDGAQGPSPGAIRTEPQGMVHGIGIGKIGRGWGLPGFGHPVSKSQGTIIIEAHIDKEGHVTSVINTSSVIINGRNYTSLAPASTDTKAIEACKADVRGRTFPRTGPDDGQGTTAYVVYNFQ